MNIDDWVIAVQGSLQLVGRPRRDDVSPNAVTMLHPVFVMSVVASAAGGNLQITRTCFPLLMYASIDEIELPRDAIVIPVKALFDKEKEELALRIEGAEKMKTALRAASSGIQLALAVPDR